MSTSDRRGATWASIHPGAVPIVALRPLDRLWEWATKGAAWLLARYLTRGLAGASLYLRGSLASGDARFRVSDIDISLITPDHPTRPGSNRALLVERWRGIKRRVPALDRAFDFFAWEEAELERGAAGGSGWQANGRSSLLDMSVSVRPGLYGPTSQWALLSGPDRRPERVQTGSDRSDLWWAAWTELQFWCRQAFAAAMQPGPDLIPYFAFKLAAEPLRIRLWVAHGVRAECRREVLDRAAYLMPEEAETVDWARSLTRSVSRARAEILLSDALQHFFRLSERLAALLCAEGLDAGVTEVRLLGSPGGPAGSDRPLFPLLDWVARTCPTEVEEWCSVQDGDPADPATLRHAAITSSAKIYPLLRTGQLVVLPVSDIGRARVRAIQCVVTDPVTFSLAAGNSVASFAELPRWSAHDCASRAIEDHAARLPLRRQLPFGELGLRRIRRWLVTATRAALFFESVQSGRPELAVTLDAVVEQLAWRDPIAAEILSEVVSEVRCAPERASRRVEELRRLVAAMEPFARVKAEATC